MDVPVTAGSGGLVVTGGKGVGEEDGVAVKLGSKAELVQVGEAGDAAVSAGTDEDLARHAANKTAIPINLVISFIGPPADPESRL